jgi:hypothetical protein
MRRVSVRLRNPDSEVAEKEKGPTLVGPVSDQLFCDRPGPDDPGGLGAEESGIERTGPTQMILIAIQQGTHWAEVGRYYDRTNDPVTGDEWAVVGRKS